MASERARALVGELHGRGMSYAEIERRLGRGRGSISQIARGARSAGYGQSLVPFLEEILAGAAHAEPPRRTDASGVPARTRRSARTALPGGNVHYETKRGYKTLTRELERAGEADKQVRLTVRARHVEGGSLARTESGSVDVDIFSSAHGGYDANSLLNRLEDAGYADNPRRAIETLAAQRGVEIRGIQQIIIRTQDKRG